MEVHMIRDDITHMKVDAIMNPTNSRLYGFSGIDGLVHQAGGAELEAQCSKFSPISIGEAVVTLAFGLPCKKIVHVAVPRWRGGLSGEKLLMRTAYLEGLRAAFREKDIHSLAIPLMGSGGYGFPMSEAFRIADGALKEFEKEIRRKKKGFTVYLVMYSVESMIEMSRLMMDIMENIDDEYAEAHPNRFVREQDDPDMMFQKVHSLTNPMVKTKKETLDEYIKKNKGSFQATLFTYVKRSGKQDSEIYRAAGITKSLYSKMKNPSYNVQKDSVLRLAVALELNIEETYDLLESAGYAIDTGKISDLVFEYSIINRQYDIDRILYEIDERLG